MRQNGGGHGCAAHKAAKRLLAAVRCACARRTADLGILLRLATVETRRLVCVLFTSKRLTSMGTTAGFVLGIGLGGFVDGITLHQIMQWHNMGSAMLPPVTMEAMSQNMVWDGLFHAATLVLTVIGVVKLWSEGKNKKLPASMSVLFGQMILGWGLCNLIEGIINHHLLQLHHVRDMPTHMPLYDWIFLAGGGIGFILLGWMLSRHTNLIRPR